MYLKILNNKWLNENELPNVILDPDALPRCCCSGSCESSTHHSHQCSCLLEVRSMKGQITFFCNNKQTPKKRGARRI